MPSHILFSKVSPNETNRKCCAAIESHQPARPVSHTDDLRTPHSVTNPLRTTFSRSAVPIGIDIFLIILQHWGLPLEHYRVVSNSTTYTKELHNSTIVNSRKSRVPHPQKKTPRGKNAQNELLSR